MIFKNLKDLDYKLILTVLLLHLCGITLIASATKMNLGYISREFIIQNVSFGLGIVSIIGMMFFDYRDLKRYHWIFYGIGLVLLAIVFIPGVGINVGGSTRWVNIGIMNLQTSEVVKITYIISFAAFVEERRGNFDTWKDLIPPALYILPIFVLMMRQPDLGGSIVFIVISFSMLFISGLNMKIVGMASGLFLASMPMIYRFVLRPHQRVRIDAFLNPSDPSFPGNFQVIQSMIAIGSGQIFGKGLFRGTQNQLHFLPVQESDFIFAVLGEEFGLVGMSVVVLLFFFFLIRVLKNAVMAKDFYGTLIVTGVLSMFTYQIFQNIGMVMGIMPVTGVTLPFISYGGSSMLTSMIAVGLVINVSIRIKHRVN